MKDSLEKELVGHWKCAGALEDVSARRHKTINHGVVETPEGAVFNGRDSFLEIPDSDALALGRDDFAIAAWIHTEKDLDDAIGDIMSKFDPRKRKGFTLSVNHTVAAPTSQANYRNLHFGIDDQSLPTRVLDCGRLGTSVWVAALAVHDGDLYAGTCEFCCHEAGHVYRYVGGKDWVDCGSPDRSNTVASLASWEGALYAATSCSELHYSLGFSSPNTAPGGWLYRYEGDKKWTCCGRGNETDTVRSLAVFKGRLYATTSSPDICYRYEGDGRWTALRGPGELTMSLGVYHGHLYATANYRNPDRHRLFRYDEGKDAWEGCGKIEQASQVYAQAIHRGKLYVATYPFGKVYRYDGGETLVDVGHLGRDQFPEEIPAHMRFYEPDWKGGQVYETCVLWPKEQEIQAMTVYNGKLYAGTIPSAEVYRYDGDTTWTLVGCTDGTASAYLRRAWCMAIFQGKLFVGALPSGFVFGFEAGKIVTYDRELPSGWQHIVAQKTDQELQLLVNGRMVARAQLGEANKFDISNGEPLHIGFGSHDYFCGKMKDIRIYRRSLSEEEIGHHSSSK